MGGEGDSNDEEISSALESLQEAVDFFDQKASNKEEEGKFVDQEMERYIRTEAGGMIQGQSIGKAFKKRDSFFQINTKQTKHDSPASALDDATSFEKLYDVDEWDVDMITIAEQAKSPLVKVCMHISLKYSLHEVADISREVMAKFFHEVEKGYLPQDKVPYHNAIHAADVAHMMHFFLRPEDPKNPTFLPKAVFASVIAAAALCRWPALAFSAS